MDGGALLLLLGTELEVLAATQVLHLEARALLALHLQSDLLRHLSIKKNICHHKLKTSALIIQPSTTHSSLCTRRRLRHLPTTCTRTILCKPSKTQLMLAMHPNIAVIFATQ